MSSFHGNRGVHLAVWIGLGAAGILAAPSACLYPEHTFDEQEPSGGSGGDQTEDCDNGIDDNGDGLADCGDPACSTFACVPELAAGWTGYFALFEGAPGEDPGCKGGFTATMPPPFLGNDGLSASPAACTCSCGPAEGQECAPLDTLNILINDAACGSPDATCSGTRTPPPEWTGDCENNGAFRGGQLTCGPSSETCGESTGAPCNVSVTVGPLTASGGQCNPVVGLQKPSLTWAKLGRACAAEEPLGTGCNVGQVCLPRPSAPFGSGVCIAKDGDNTCPPGSYTSHHVLYTDAEDSRDCEGCTCAAPSGGTCPTTLAIYSDLPLDICSTRIAMVQAGTCSTLNGNPTVAGLTASAPGAPTGATCTPSTARPKGEAKGINPRTFCCIP